jgi:beta-lactamase class A
MRVPRRPFFAMIATLALAACATPRPQVRIEPLSPGGERAPAAAPGAVAAAATVSALAMPAVALAGDDPPASPRPVAPPSRGGARPATLPGALAPTTYDFELQGVIEAALGADADHYSIVVRRLHDGRTAALNPNREYYAASLFKLALLYEAERQRSTGLLSFDQGMEVTARDAAEDLGTLGALGAGIGDTLPVREAVRAMVTISDNTSAVMMLYLLGPGNVDRTLRSLGLTVTSVNTTELPTTAADMALLMETIVRGRGVDADARDEMLSLLAKQETRSGIPRSLPAGVRVGNKTGTWPGATHDVAYVDAPNGAYVIAILSDRGWEWDPIARVSRAVYDALTR